MAEIHANGFSKTGVDAIARAAEVPKGSFYNIFESKDNFGAEIINLYFERHQTKLSEFFDDSSLTPMERLRAYFEERTDFFTKINFRRGCMMGNLSLEMADHSEAMRLRLQENFRSWSGVLVRTIAEAQQAGELTRNESAEILGEFILNSWEGALLRMKTEQSARPLENAKKVIFSCILL